MDNSIKKLKKRVTIFGVISIGFVIGNLWVRSEAPIMNKAIVSIMFLGILPWFLFAYYYVLKKIYLHKLKKK
ncbi:hypothetical protein EV581_102584 [Bacillus sp. BK006]|nr:hypothetical protein EV581_102584 [Bacillus sp. BK006]